MTSDQRSGGGWLPAGPRSVHVQEVPTVCFIPYAQPSWSGCKNWNKSTHATGKFLALVVVNAINHRETLQPVLERALADARVDALVVPIGKGGLVCRKV